MSALKIENVRAGARVVDLERPSVYQGVGGQSLNLSTKAAVLKRESLLNGGAKHVDWGGWPPPILSPGLYCNVN